MFGTGEMGVVWLMNIQHSVNAHNSAQEVIVARWASNVYYCAA